MTFELMARTRDIVLAAGRIVRTHWEKTSTVTHKGRIDLVTETDLAVEHFLKESLGELLPGSTFLAEESDPNTQLGDETWIIDPLDGTTNFAHRIPMVAVSVALWTGGQVTMGLVHLPLMDEMYTARLGKGAFFNDRPITVSQTSTLSDSVIATGFPYSVREDIEPIIKSLRRVLCAAQGVRRAGAAAVDLAWLACGRFDGFYEMGLKPWDTAAGILLIQEAGGQISTFDPHSPYTLGSRTILASNGKIHQDLSDLLAS